jgi:beta-glucosidase-like glycosyl hydrolase
MSRLIVGIRRYPPPPEILRAARAGRLAGLLWFRDAFGRTVGEAAERVAEMRATWHPSAPCIFAIDEEGGLIQQLSGLEEPSGEAWPRLPSPRALGRSGDPAFAHAHGREIGRRLRRLGLDVALAPSVDLDPGPGSPVLGTRCIGDDPEHVAGIAMAWLRGLTSAGIRGCLKHYPGHGATVVDSHVDLPRVGPGVDPAPHLEPFRRIAREWRAHDGPPPALLTAHIICGDATLPASLDSSILDGVPAGLGPIVTDSLDMGALAAVGDLAARMRAATQAGSDLLLIGIDVAAALAAAGSVDASPSARVSSWGFVGAVPAIPEAWSRAKLDEVAVAGLKLHAESMLPTGPWTWILPERWGPYGEVAAPPQESGGARSIARLVRYRADDPSTLDQALANAVDPCLVGWIHRGPEDVATRDLLRRAGPRVLAVAHLLDGPTGLDAADRWTVEACGFGEGEMAAIARHWADAKVDRIAR